MIDVKRIFVATVIREHKKNQWLKNLGRPYTNSTTGKWYNIGIGPKPQAFVWKFTGCFFFGNFIRDMKEYMDLFGFWMNYGQGTCERDNKKNKSIR